MNKLISQFSRRLWVLVSVVAILATVAAVVSLGTSEQESNAAAQPSDDVCARRLAEANRGGPLKYDWVVVDLTGPLTSDEELTKAWLEDAEDVAEALGSAELEYYRATDLVSTRSWTPVEGGVRSAPPEDPVVLDRRWADAAQRAGATAVLAGTYSFRDRNIAEYVIDQELSGDGQPAFYSVCGDARVGASVTSAFDKQAGTSLDLASALVAESNAQVLLDQADPAELTQERAAQLHAEWSAAEPDQRTVFAGDLPSEVSAKLQPHNIGFDLPPAWFRNDATICFQSELAWLNCTALDVLDDAGELASLTVHVPDDFKVIEVVLNDALGSYRSDLQLKLGEILPSDLRVDTSIRVQVRGDFPTDTQRRSDVTTHTFAIVDGVD